MNKKTQQIVFLHLSDLHIDKEKDISDEHIQKIVDSIKSYKSITFKNIVIILSGDITQTGDEYQFSNAKKLIGNLIVKLKKTFGCKYTILVVPGNHDINHKELPLDLEELKKK